MHYIVQVDVLLLLTNWNPHNLDPYYVNCNSWFIARVVYTHNVYVYTLDEYKAYVWYRLDTQGLNANISDKLGVNDWCDTQRILGETDEVKYEKQFARTRFPY